MLRAWLRLIRFPNLVIVIITQYFLYYGIILPMLKEASITPIFNDFHFALFVLVTVMITAGGNLINDILDYEIDLINKPHKVVIEKKVSMSMAWQVYYGLNGLGLILALYLAFYVGHLSWFLLFPLAVFGLYQYSVRLKKMALWGNLLVATYCAGVALILLLAERDALSQLNAQSYSAILNWVSWYTIFAFISTFFREIIKDMEDVQGDVSHDCRTAPIRWGVPASKWIAFPFGLSLALLSLSLILGLPNNVGQSLIFILVTIPSLFGLWLLYFAQTKKQFHFLSQWAKLIMLSGIVVLFVLSTM